MTSNSKTEGRFGKQDFRYVAKEDVYIRTKRCHANPALRSPGRRVHALERTGAPKSLIDRP